MMLAERRKLAPEPSLLILHRQRNKDRDGCRDKGLTCSLPAQACNARILPEIGAVRRRSSKELIGLLNPKAEVLVCMRCCSTVKMYTRISCLSAFSNTNMIAAKSKLKSSRMPIQVLSWLRYCSSSLLLVLSRA